MSQLEALKRLEALGVSFLETSDAAALLGVSRAGSHMILKRLAAAGFLVHLARGRWALAGRLNPFAAAELLAAPEPAYVSLQSALFHHGLISQIPAVVYAVTVGRTRRYATPLGTFSFHAIPPELFLGFETAPGDTAKIATPEKALFDLFYLGPARSRLFARLPELEIPRTFRWGDVRRFVRLVRSKQRRSYLEKRIAESRDLSEV